MTATCACFLVIARQQASERMGVMQNGHLCSTSAHFSVLLVSLMTCMAALTSGLTMSV